MISGAAHNIGSAIAQSLASDGLSIIVSDRLRWQPKLGNFHLHHK